MTLDTFTLQIIERLSATYRVDPIVVRAIIAVEYAGNPQAVRFEPNFKYITETLEYAKATGVSVATEVTLQKMSWGLMQVMGATARGLGYQGPLISLAVSASLGLEFGIKYLKSRYQRYAPASTGWSEPVIAAYNAGSPTKDGQGKWTNSGYVARVEEEYLALRKL